MVFLDCPHHREVAEFLKRLIFHVGHGFEARNFANNFDQLFVGSIVDERIALTVRQQIPLVPTTTA